MRIGIVANAGVWNSNVAVVADINKLLVFHILEFLLRCEGNHACFSINGVATDNIILLNTIIIVTIVLVTD